LAIEENAEALQLQTLQEYNTKTVWYAAAYGVDMQSIMNRAYFRFFVMSPRRWRMLLRLMPWRNLPREFFGFLRLFFRRKRTEDEPLPEELQPLSHLSDADEIAVTSAQAQRKRREPRVARSFS